MTSRRSILLLMATAAAMLCSDLLVAQTTRRDLVELESGGRLSGRVLEESLRGVKLDRLDGNPPETIELNKVKIVIYAERPRYLLEAMDLRDNIDEQQKYLDTLRRAYHDNSTSRWQLQHVYYEIAQEYDKLSVVDEKYLDMALAAYQKLLDDIPDSRYALKLRLNLSDMFLARGEMERARKNLEGIIGSGFGPTHENAARFRQVEIYLLDNKPDEAAAALEKIDPARLDAPWPDRLSLMKADVLAVKGEQDKAFEIVIAILEKNRTPALEPHAYLILGNIFRERGRNDEALLSYLRVHLMNENVETITHARALVGAARILRRTGRRDQAGELQTHLDRLCPGPFWEKLLSQ